MPEAADARSVDVGRVTRQYLALGALVPGALGLLGVLAAVTGAGLAGGSGTGVRLGAGVVGALLLAVTGAVGWLLAVHPPQSWLDVSPAGLVWRTRRELALAWDEIERLALVRSRTRVEAVAVPTARGVTPLLGLGRRYLRITVTPAAARRADVRQVLGFEVVLSGN